MKCRDCGHEMEQYRQEHMHGAFTDVVTCKRVDCTLWAVTLAIDTYAKLTDAQVNDYRAMVVKLKERYLTMGAA